MFDYYSIVTEKQVLEKFTQEEIFGYILKDEISLDRKYCSPLRTDRKPGCYFSWWNDMLFFVDFASYPSHYTCFQLYERVYAIPHKMVYDHIYNNVEKGYSCCSNVISCKGSNSKKRLKNTKISILPKDWSRDEELYWLQYGITLKQLKSDGVIPLKAVMIDNGKKNYSFQIEKIGFAYTEFESGHKKIYQPYNKQDKWFTNCNANDIGNIGNIPETGYFLIVTKSYKDCRVIRNLGYNCVWFQNEGMCPSNDVLESLVTRFEKIKVLFDNDATGIRAGEDIAKRISKFNGNTKAIHLPEVLFEKGIKDSSDLVKTTNYDLLNKFLKNKLND